jgi:predicted nucleotidyltransferase
MGYHRAMIADESSNRFAACDGDALRLLTALDWSALAARHGWRLVVLFGSSARGAAGRDIDLALLPALIPDLLEHGRWQAELEGLLAPRPVDLVLLGAATSPVTRFEVFRAGRCLYEAETGLFERERDRAFFLYADSEWFRRQQREVLRGGAG